MELELKQIKLNKALNLSVQSKCYLANPVFEREINHLCDVMSPTSGLITAEHLAALDLPTPNFILFNIRP